MKRFQTRFESANPWLTWTQIAFKTGEMMMASAQVIHYRTGRIAAAGTSPNARDRREFALMGQEKVAAATESMQAIASRMVDMNMQFSALVFRQAMDGASTFVTLMATPALALSAKGQAELLRDAIKNSARLATQLSTSMARVAHHGMTPIHSRATGNARRLLKLA